MKQNKTKVRLKSMKDIELIPLQDLVKELKSRCGTFICAYQTIDASQRASNFTVISGKTMKSTFMADILHRDCINEWHKSDTNA